MQRLLIRQIEIKKSEKRAQRWIYQYFKEIERVDCFYLDKLEQLMKNFEEVKDTYETQRKIYNETGSFLAPKVLNTTTTINTDSNFS